MLHFNMWLETPSAAVAASVLVLFLQRTTCYNRHFICFYLEKQDPSKTHPISLRHNSHKKTKPQRKSAFYSRSQHEG